MRIRRVFVPYAAVAVAVFAIGIPAQAGISEQLGVQRLRDELPAGTPLVTDPVHDAIEALRGLDLALPGAERDPGAAAADWVRQHAAAFGLVSPDDALVVERVERLRDGAHRVLLRQVWRGHRVHGGDARLVLSASGRLRAVAAGFRVALAAPVEPRVSREAAVLQSAEALAASLADAPAAAELWCDATISRTGSRGAWRCRSRTEVR